MKKKLTSQSGTFSSGMNFAVTLTDNASPGALDKLFLNLSNGYSVDANLSGGNIAIK